ncbi:MAG: hypothetical protein ACRERE_28980 [Candidatus Entotheonellia bacterium]
MLYDVEVRCVAHDVGVPVGPAQQVLEAIRGGLAADLGQLPAVLALDGTEQAPQRGHRPQARLGTGEMRTKPLLDVRQICCQPLHHGDLRLQRRGDRWCLSWLRPFPSLVTNGALTF